MLICGPNRIRPKLYAVQGEPGITLNSAVLKTLIPSLPTWAEAALVLSLSWIAAGALIKPLAPAADALLPVSSGKENYSVNIRGLLDAAPFGKLAPVRTTANKPVVKSSLAIKLLGTVVAGRQSAALLQSKPGAIEEVYHIGEAIMPGVILQDIESTRILIGVSGRREIIMLDESEPLNTLPFQPISARKPGIHSGVQHLGISRSMLNREMQNMAKLLRQARLTPQSRSGKPNGFLISEIVAGSIYQRIGLHNGDIIQSVNGMSLSNADRTVAILKVLKENRHVEVALWRNERLLRLQYDIR